MLTGRVAAFAVIVQAIRLIAHTLHAFFVNRCNPTIASRLTEPQEQGKATAQWFDRQAVMRASTLPTYGRGDATARYVP
jgi:hypothetical protein